MNIIKKLYAQYKDLILYVVFGALTTAVNVISYMVLYRMQVSNLISTILAWLLSVLFAFVTNKIWVFESRSFAPKVLLYEMGTFFSCRIATGLVDLGIMYLAVDCMGWNELVWKLLSNVLVIILNFIASKLLIFRKKS